jgi:hypothetical protein
MIMQAHTKKNDVSDEDLLGGSDPSERRWRSGYERH